MAGIVNLTDHDLRISALEGNMETMISDYNESLDTIWMLLASMLVFFMHSGFSLLEAGSVRIKNAQNILAKNLVVVTVGFLCWYFVGYPIAFGGNGYALNGFFDKKEDFRMWFFQGTFCATGGTIVSGAMAERTQLKGFGLFTILMTSFMYPAVVYWGWSGKGFLYYTENNVAMSSFGPPYLDFAGSGIVHLTGGIAAFVGAVLVGPRKGRYSADEADEFVAHNVPLCVLGTFFLWFGWYGFNPGSTLEMHTVESANRAAIVAVNTTLSPCVAGLLVFFLRAQVCEPKCLDVGGFCNGILAGLVAITASCSVVKSWEAMIIGLVGGLLYQGAAMLLPKLQIDDVVDASAVHGVAGLWAVLAAGLFGNPAEGLGGNGLFYGGDQLRTQLMAALIIITWSGVLSFVIFLPLRLFGMLRMGDNFQDKGADIMEHSPAKAYAGDAVSPYAGDTVTDYVDNAKV